MTVTNRTTTESNILVVPLPAATGTSYVPVSTSADELWSRSSLLSEILYDDDWDLDDILGDVIVGGNGNFSFELNVTKMLPTAFQQTMWYLNLYFTPVIILIGLIGNLLSMLVFTFTHVQRLSASIYLSSLAVADVLFLIVLAIAWVDRRLGITAFVIEGWCQFVVYVTHVAGFMAVWTVLSFTAERYIITYHPHKKDVWCTRRRATMVVVGLTLFALLFYSYVIWTYDIIRFGGHTACSPVPRHHEINNILTSIDTIIACAVPSVVIVILNIKIMIKIHEFQKIRNKSKHDLVQQGIYVRNRSVLHTSISTTGSMHIKFSTNRIVTLHDATSKEIVNPEINKCKAMMRNRSQFRTARMLLVLSSVFVLLNLPYHIFRVQSFLGHLFGSSTKAARNRMAWDELFQLLYFLNFAINFFIYSACGRQFRVGLRRLVRKWKHKLHTCRTDIMHIGRYSTRRIQRREELMLNGIKLHLSN